MAPSRTSDQPSGEQTAGCEGPAGNEVTDSLIEFVYVAHLHPHGPNDATTPREFLASAAPERSRAAELLGRRHQACRERIGQR